MKKKENPSHFSSFEKDELYDYSKFKGGEECDTKVYSGGELIGYDENVSDSTTFQGNLDDDVQDCDRPPVT